MLSYPRTMRASSGCDVAESTEGEPSASYPHRRKRRLAKCRHFLWKALLHLLIITILFIFSGVIQKRRHLVEQNPKLRLVPLLGGVQIFHSPSRFGLPHSSRSCIGPSCSQLDIVPKENIGGVRQRLEMKDLPALAPKRRRRDVFDKVTTCYIGSFRGLSRPLDPSRYRPN